MKAVCHICEQAFELAKVTYDKDSGIVGDGEGFYLLPTHDPIPGKKVTEVINTKTKEIVQTMCGGSLRPPKIAVH